MTRIVVLGATGFIGSAVLAALARRDVRLRAVATRPAQVPAGARADVQVCACDLTEPGTLRAAVADADVVVYALGYRTGSGSWRVGDGDAAAERINLGLVRELVSVARPGAVVLYAGTKSQLGATDKVRIDGSEPDRPRTPYGRQKLAAEQALMQATAEGRLRAVSLRLPTTYGHTPGTDAPDRGIISAMARRALAGESITMWHDGTVRRDLLHVDDAAAAFTAALDHVDALAGRHWVIGTGRAIALGDVLGTVTRLVALGLGNDPVPVQSVPPPDSMDPADLESIEFDASAFTAITGWHPGVLAEIGVRRTVEFLVREFLSRQPVVTG